MIRHVLLLLCLPSLELIITVTGACHAIYLSLLIVQQLFVHTELYLRAIYYSLRLLQPTREGTLTPTQRAREHYRFRW